MANSCWQPCPPMGKIIRHRKCRNRHRKCHQKCHRKCVLADARRNMKATGNGGVKLSERTGSAHAEMAGMPGRWHRCCLRNPWSGTRRRRYGSLCYPDLGWNASTWIHAAHREMVRFQQPSVIQSNTMASICHGAGSSGVIRLMAGRYPHGWTRQSMRRDRARASFYWCPPGPTRGGGTP